VEALKKSQVPLDQAPTKLRQAHGDIVLGLLHALVDKVLSNGQGRQTRPALDE
jgi:hypothetical protein